MLNGDQMYKEIIWNYEDSFWFFRIINDDNKLGMVVRFDDVKTDNDKLELFSNMINIGFVLISEVFDICGDLWS
jgi:hypothetical protein